MNIEFSVAIKAPRRDVLGLPVCDLGFNDAFGLAAELATVPVGQSVLSFLTTASARLAMQDAAYRDLMSRHVLLATDDGIATASKLLQGQGFATLFKVASFVPALLTFLEKPVRIGIVGSNPQSVARTCQLLAAHVPWHEVVVVPRIEIEQPEKGRVPARPIVDILVVDMDETGQERWIEQHVRPRHGRLVLSAPHLCNELANGRPTAPGWVRRMKIDWLHGAVLDPAKSWNRLARDTAPVWWQMTRQRLGWAAPAVSIRNGRRQGS